MLNPGWHAAACRHKTLHPKTLTAGNSLCHSRLWENRELTQASEPSSSEICNPIRPRSNVQLHSNVHAT